MFNHNSHKSQAFISNYQDGTNCYLKTSTTKHNPHQNLESPNTYRSKVIFEDKFHKKKKSHL